MTKDEALKIAAKCGNDNSTTERADLDFLVRFAEAVAAAEREACAKPAQSCVMTKPQALDIIMLLSALESWSFSTGKMLPDHTFDKLQETIELLRTEILKED